MYKVILMIAFLAYCLHLRIEEGTAGALTIPAALAMLYMMYNINTLILSIKGKK